MRETMEIADRSFRQRTATARSLSSLLVAAFSVSKATAFLITTVRVPTNPHSIPRCTSQMFATTMGQPSPAMTSTIEETTASVASLIVGKFEIESEFNPPSGVLSHHHVQTIGGFLLRQKGIGVNVENEVTPGRLAQLAWQYFTTETVPEDSEFWDKRERIDTPDGDWFHADTKFASDTTADTTAKSLPTVLVLHGLESNSNSMLTKEMARVITEECNMHCTCLNFRGCSGTPNDNIGAYHLGFTDDLRHYLDQRFRTTSATKDSPPVYLTGFSLGANAILKCLGELGSDATTLYNIQGGVGLCAPLDQERNARALAKPGINRIVYTNMLLKSLKAKAKEQIERFGSESYQPFDYDLAMQAETITEFDDAFIAPIYGFKDCWDYYRQTSSIHVLDNITVPTLILNAKDDPFMDPTVAYEKSGGPVLMISMPHGGHLGFALHQTENPQRASWCSHEMGRFLRHVQDEQN